MDWLERGKEREIEDLTYRATHTAFVEYVHPAEDISSQDDSEVAATRCAVESLGGHSYTP